MINDDERFNKVMMQIVVKSIIGFNFVFTRENFKRMKDNCGSLFSLYSKKVKFHTLKEILSFSLNLVFFPPGNIWIPIRYKYSIHSAASVN